MIEPTKALNETNFHYKGFGTVESMKNIFSGVDKHLKD